MDGETRRFPNGEPARVEEQAAQATQQEPAGSPTTYLPPAAGPNAAEAVETNGGPRYGGYVAPPAGRTGRVRSGNNIAALALIGLGLFFLLGQGGRHMFGAAIPLAIGLVFLYAYNQSGRKFGFLVPGAILTGLGTGIVLEELTRWGDGFVPLGLGLGFLSLWMMRREQWWWLIPGGILSLVGLDDLFTHTVPFGSGGYIPIALIALGLYLLMQRRSVTR